MSMTGFTNYATVDGQQVFTVADVITGTADAVGESILLKADGAIRASGTGVITFTRCQIFINDVAPAANWWAIQEAALSYNGANGNRSGVSSHINFIDCSITFLATGTRAIFISQVQNTRVYSTGSATVRLYTQETTNLDDMHIDDISWELIGEPSASGNLRIENAGSGPTNFDSGRMDLPYIKEVNVPTSLNLGTGNSGNNEWGIWNPILFDNETVNMSSANSAFFDGWTAGWSFTNRDSGDKVEDVTVILSSDRSGSMTELGRYSTDSDGELVGTYDSKAFTTGGSQSRPTLYFPKNEADQSGSSHGTGAFTYDLVTILHAVEVRAFGFQASVDFSLGDTHAPTGPVGSINSDYTVGDLVNFILNNLLDLTETNPVTVAAYTDLGPANKFYDRAHYEWFANDEYPVITRVGDQMVLDDIVLTLDATGSVYVAASLTAITAKAATCEFGMTTTTGKLILLNGVLLSGETFAGDIEIDNTSDGDTYTGITASKIIHTGTGTQALTLDGANVTELEVTGGATLTVTLTNGSSVPTLTQTSGTITLINDMTVTISGLTIGDTIRVEDNAEVQQEFATASGTTYQFTIDRANDGETWKYAVDRAGYSADTGVFAVAEGTSLDINVALREYIRGAGAAMYAASSCPLCTVSFDLITPQATIDIADGVANLQGVFDNFEDALLTADGMAWHSQQGSICQFDDLPGVGKILFMGPNIRVRRDSAGDINSAVDGYLLSQDGTPVDGTNGGVVYVAGSTNSELAQAVWEYVTRTLTSSAGATAAEVWAYATRTITGGVVDTNNDMRGTDGANTVVPDNAGIAANGVAIGNLNDLSTADIDARLAAYGIPTLTEMTAAFTQIKGAGWTTTDTLEAIRNAVDGGTTPAQIWAYVARTITGGTIDTTNDMRGTDSANTVVPDNAGIAANGVAIGNLNDLSTADIDARLTAYGIPTLTELTAAFTEIKGAGWTTTDTLEAIRNAVDAVSGSALTATQVWAHVTRTVTGGTIDTNNDMRGSDIAPDNAGIAVAETQATLARQGILNRFKITVDNLATLYADDGTTPLVVFDLKDIDGVAAYINSTERAPQ